MQLIGLNYSKPHEINTDGFTLFHTNVLRCWSTNPLVNEHTIICGT